MLQLTNMTTRLLAAAAFCGALALGPARAAEMDNNGATAAPPAQSGTTEAPAAKPSAEEGHKKHTASTPTERVEARIKELRSQLHITKDQDQQWQALTQVMRDNAAAYEARMNDREDHADMTAVDDLRSYQQMTAAHAADLEKLTNAFQALYDTMSDQQKKTADAIFAKSEQRREQKAMHKKAHS